MRRAQWTGKSSRAERIGAAVGFVIALLMLAGVLAGVLPLRGYRAAEHVPDTKTPSPEPERASSS